MAGSNDNVKPAISAEQAKALRPIEHAIEEEQWSRARSLAEQQLAITPDLARLHLLVGTIELRDGAAAAGFKALREAIALDRGYRRDVGLLRRAAAALTSRKGGPAAVAFLGEAIGAPACPSLVEAASSSRIASVRAPAREAARQNRCVGVDLPSSYGLDLRQTRDCEARRAAVAKLRDLGGPRAIEQLRKAKKGSGSSSGIASLFEDSDDEDDRPKADCGGVEIDQAIEALSSH